MSDIIGFRRIKGRVIPIRKSKGTQIQKASAPESKPTAQQKASRRAGFNVASGFGIGAIGGVVAAALDRSHANLYNTARNARGDMFTRKFAAKTRLEGMRAGISAKRIKSGSAAIGATLIAAGTHQLLKNTDLTTEQKAGISASSGLGAYFAVRLAHTKILGDTTFKFAAKHALRRVLVRGMKL